MDEVVGHIHSCVVTDLNISEKGTGVAKKPRPVVQKQYPIPIPSVAKNALVELKSGIIRESSSPWRSRQLGSKVYDQGNATFIDSVSIYDARLMRLQSRTVTVSP